MVGVGGDGVSGRRGHEPGRTALLRRQGRPALLLGLPPEGARRDTQLPAAICQQQRWPGGARAGGPGARRGAAAHGPGAAAALPQSAACPGI